MLILALETTTVVSGVAVATEDRLLAEVTAARLTHSETLQSHVALALDMAGVAKSEVEAVAVSQGPGSFTGLRIGLFTMYPRQGKIYPICSKILLSIFGC